MQIAVAQMAKAVDPEIPQARQRLRRTRDKLGHLGQGQRNVVVRDRPHLAIGQRQTFSNPPQPRGLRCRMGHNPIAHQTSRHRLIQKPRHQRLGVFKPRRQAKFDQHRPFWQGLQRHPNLGHMLGQKLQPLPMDQFKGRDHARRPRLSHRQELQRPFGRRHRQKGRRHAGRARKQPQGGGGDDTQCALGPNHQMAQIIAGVILAQSLQPVQHTSIGQNRFDPQTQIARIAIAQHVYPTRIGGQDAPHPRRAFRGERQGKEPVNLFRLSLHRGHHHASLDHQSVLRWVSRAHSGHPLQRQDQGHWPPLHDLPAHKPRAAAHWHNANPRCRTGAHHLGHLCRGSWPRHNTRHALPAPARLFQITWLGQAQRPFGQARSQIGNKTCISRV